MATASEPSAWVIPVVDVPLPECGAGVFEQRTLTRGRPIRREDAERIYGPARELGWPIHFHPARDPGADADEYDAWADRMIRKHEASRNRFRSVGKYGPQAS